MATKRMSASGKEDKKLENETKTNDQKEPLVTEEEKNMSIDEKLELIDKEIRALHHYCISKGYTPWQIERTAAPLFKAAAWGKRKRVARRCGKAVLMVAALVLIGVALWHFDPTYRMILMYSRLASIKILPYWDWAAIYNQDCLIENPYYVPPSLTDKDCEACLQLKTIERVENVSHGDMSDLYLRGDTPVIVTDATKQWPAMQKLSHDFIYELYHTEVALMEEPSCQFTSSVDIKKDNHRMLLTKAYNKKIQNWYAYWENCQKRAAKVLRQFYSRPYFVPPMVEMAEGNWLYISSNFKKEGGSDSDFIPADMNKAMVWWAQIRGQTKVKLTPKVPCEKNCTVIYTTVKPGEILVYTDLIWLLDYQPAGEENVALAAGGFWE